MTEEEKAIRLAPKGQIWVCRECGKIAEDKYGLEGFRSKGWDESCTVNAVLTDRHIEHA